MMRKSQGQNPSNDWPLAKTSNQALETDGVDKLEKYLEVFIKEKENEDNLEEGKITFSPGHLVFQPPLAVQTMIAIDLRTPDLPFLWASICILVLALPSNATDVNFDNLNKFLTKMKEGDQWFTVFSHNLSHYGTLNLPIEVNKWLVYFPKKNLIIQGRDV